MEGKYIIFELAGHTAKTEVYDILAKEDRFCLGQIKWHGPWRKYCFFPVGNAVFENVCLGDIMTFISELMEKRKKR